MRENIFILPFLAALLFLAGCVSEFKNPLPAPKVIKVDSALLGTWETYEDKAERNKIQVSFFGRKSGWIDIVYVENAADPLGTRPDDGVDILIFEAYTTNVNKDTFLCLRSRKQNNQDQKNGESTYLLAHYHLSKEGTLSISLFNENSVERMVKKGLLKLELQKVNGSSEKIVVSSSDKIASAIAKEGIESFISKNDTLKFRKLK